MIANKFSNKVDAHHEGDQNNEVDVNHEGDTEHQAEKKIIMKLM